MKKEINKKIFDTTINYKNKNLEKDYIDTTSTNNTETIEVKDDSIRKEEKNDKVEEKEEVIDESLSEKEKKSIIYTFFRKLSTLTIITIITIIILFVYQDILNSVSKITYQDNATMNSITSVYSTTFGTLSIFTIIFLTGLSIFQLFMHNRDI